MKKSILILIACSIPFSLVIGQNLKNPSWISGSWENSLVSDLSESIAWTFEHDSIFIEKGSPKTRKRKCISIDLQGLKQTRLAEDSLYRVTFIGGNNTIVYEFKLVKDDLSRVTGEPVLTFSLTINGIKKIEHSKSANLMFLKKEFIPVMLTPM